MYKQSLLLSISKGLKSISALIITMIIARVLSQSDYGIYRQYTLITNLLGSILVLGVPTSVSYLFKIIDRKDLSKLFTSTTVILATINILTLLILIVFKKPFIFLFSKDGEIGNYYILLVLYIIAIVFFSFLENIYISDNRGYIFAKVNSIYFVIQIVLYIYVSYRFKDLYLILLTLLLLEIGRGIFLYFHYKISNSIHFDVDAKLINRQIKLALPIGLSFIAQTLNLYLGNLYVSKNYSVDDFAVFSVGVTEIPFVSIVTISIAAAILPTLSQKYNKDHNPREMLKIWKDSTVIGSIFIFPIFWILLFFSDGYIEFIFSKEYLPAKYIFIVFLLKLPLAITVFGNILIVLNKSKYILFNMISAIVINILFIIIFDKIFLLEGVALASVLTQFLLVLITLTQIKLVLGVRFKELFPFKEITLNFFISGLIILFFYFISGVFTKNNILSFFIFGGFGFLIVNLIFYLMGYSKPFIKQIKTRLRGEK